MGDTADDAVEGFACMWCGTYFENAHDYPVLCAKCFKDQKAAIKNGDMNKRDKLPLAIHKELG